MAGGTQICTKVNAKGMGKAKGHATWTISDDDEDEDDDDMTGGTQIRTKRTKVNAKSMGKAKGSTGDKCRTKCKAKGEDVAKESRAKSQAVVKPTKRLPIPSRIACVRQ
eukprot:TRINITY_DN48774_c0_g1_i1.p2 TRINITY_DN48774_c0_g1~~TRINITY_DN48774_c0_g1_i1.p2  ORF type:complete len:126 (-),score=49.69 TRINITY_DN48774_c0_g1_i1:48-374(-)